MFVCLCGRKQSGKSTLAEILIDKGFEHISFANPLKQYLSELFGIELSAFYDPIIKEQPFAHPVVWDEERCKKLSAIVGEPIEFDSICELRSIRHMMQYIGTDVLRKHDQDFHIKRFIQMIDETKNYVCDDVRFVGEYEAVKRIGAICVFVFRPGWFEYSNHQSEIDINWSMFDYVLINDTSKEQMVNKFSAFIDCLLYDEKQVMLYRNLLMCIMESVDFNTLRAAEIIGCSQDKIIWLCERFLINIPQEPYKYNHRSFLDPSKEASYLAGVLSENGCIKKSSRSSTTYVIELVMDDFEIVDRFRRFVGAIDKPIYKRQRANGKMSYTFTCNSPFILENLKLWNIKP